MFEHWTVMEIVGLVVVWMGFFTMTIWAFICVSRGFKGKDPLTGKDYDELRREWSRKRKG